MNRNFRRLSAAVLTLAVCLTISPLATARPRKDRPKFDPVEPVVRVIAKFKNLLVRVTPLDEYPTPPLPKP